jgi:hypothetical protein
MMIRISTPEVALKEPTKEPRETSSWLDVKKKQKDGEVGE